MESVIQNILNLRFKPLKKKINIFSFLKSHVSRLSYSLLLCIWVLLLSGCDQSFQPIQDNYQSPFSMFGYLDASADTQWVRVTPVRGQLDLSTNVPDMTVSLEHLETGDTAIFNDSLFIFGDGFHILNAWGQPDFLKPEQSYRFTAQRPDGAESHATVTFPPDFPTPRLEIYDIVSLAYLYIEGVEHLIDVQVRTSARVISPSAGWDYVDVFWSSLTRIDRTGPESYMVWLSPGHKFNVQAQLPEPPAGWRDLDLEYLHHQVFVASGGPEWKEEFRELDDYRYSLPEVISNVENGTGYMFGIVSKSVPFKNCYDDNEEIVACPEEAPLY